MADTGRSGHIELEVGDSSLEGDSVSEAAQPVAAQFGGTAIGVQQPHNGAAAIGRKTEDQSISADASAPITPRDRLLPRVDGQPFDERDKEIVAQTVMFRQTNSHGAPFSQVGALTPR